MLKSYKYRIYPNKSQEVLLVKTFGCVRYFWNKQVELFNSYDKETNPKVEYKSTTEHRKETVWLMEVSAAALQQKEIDFKIFKNQKFNKNRKKALGFPKFKSKSNRQSYRLPHPKFTIKDGKIRLEKIGLVKMVIDRPIPEYRKFMSVTVSKNPSNQYFASILVEQEILHLPKTGKQVGIDVGLKKFLVQSDNIIVANPHFFRDNQAKLARVQKFHSRKKKGSNRRKRARIKIARLHQKITNQRDWFLNVESMRIVRDYDLISIEDLNIAVMVKNHMLANSISDVSWGRFFQMLDYKCKWYGKELIKIGRFEPSSKICSGCGAIKGDLKLSDRTYVCEACGLSIDRDLNASLNIKALGVNSAIRTPSEVVTSCVEAFRVDL